MAELSSQQESRLKGYGPGVVIVNQEEDRAILIDLYGQKFYITPAGRVLYPQDYMRGQKSLHMGGKIAKITPQQKKVPIKPTEITITRTTIKKSQQKEFDWKDTGSYASSYGGKTFCQSEPECCKPRDIKIVAWDADHTIWNMPVTAASVTGPLKKIDEDTVVELNDSSINKKMWDTPDEISELALAITEGLSEEEKTALLGKPTEIVPKDKIRTTIKLFPTFRNTLDELEKRNIPSVIISLNTPGSVKRILKEFGLEKRFLEIRDSYENKGKVYNEITRKNGICPCSGIFVDDNMSNIRDVSAKQGMALQIGATGDIQEPVEVLKYIKD